VPVALDEVRVITAFGDSHVWVFDHLLPHTDTPGDACPAGYPITRTVRAIGWVPGLLFLLLRPLLGALGAANLVQLVSLPASAAVATVFLRRSTGVDPWVAALLGAAFGLCPTLLGTLATGEISNTQAWLLPAFLLAARPALRGSSKRGSGVAGVVGVAVVGLAAAFTSPYYALALPILAGFLALPHLRSRWSWFTLAALALSLMPAWLYYGQGAAGGGASMFRPARQVAVRPAELPHPAPVAQPETLLWHTAPAPGSDVETVHVVALGLALLAVAGVGLLRRRGAPGWSLGLGLLVGGALAALGPVLYAGGLLRGVGSTALPLPIAILEAVGWPTRQGGLYFRYAVVAELGLVLLAAVALKGRRRALYIAVAVLVLHVAEGVRASGPWGERTRNAVVGRKQLEALAGSDGAVLELPLQGPTDAWFGQSALLRAVYHRRPTTGLPRGNMQPNDPVRGRLSRALGEPDIDAAHALLRSAGYRLVVLPESHIPHVSPALDRLELALGPASRSDGLLYWDLGPATVDCAPAPSE